VKSVRNFYSIERDVYAYTAFYRTVIASYKITLDGDLSDSWK